MYVYDKKEQITSKQRDVMLTHNHMQNTLGHYPVLR